MKEIWYRYEDTCYEGGIVSISCHQYEVSKRTAKGAWLRVPNMSGTWKRFVLNNARKKYAHPTKTLALESFKARKRRQRAIYLAGASRAEKALEEVSLRTCNACNQIHERGELITGCVLR